MPLEPDANEKEFPSSFWVFDGVGPPFAKSETFNEQLTLMKYTADAISDHWEPLQVRDLIRQAQMDGHHPSRLFLGQYEAGYLRDFLAKNFEDSVPAAFTDTYYLGLKVEATAGEHLIAIDGEQLHPHPEEDLPPIGNNAGPSQQNEPNFDVASELVLFHEWKTDALRDLIERKSTAGRTPAFLFVGRHEAYLLRKHLGAAFGNESVRSLKNLYYMGLEVIEVNTDHFLRTAGMKRVKQFRERAGRTPKWKDISNVSFWHPSFG